ncbi:RNA-directed DNA polymerase [Flavobacterium inviolabile]|uniref:RNA-directed DNA polymerase n=1 Tax=Flavobacterium inviolabile TaxID=2748320 RepID=UPI0015AD885B|nr:RNA-directed DNA polymerase [Flavobacterium inviolabile]
MNEESILNDNQASLLKANTVRLEPMFNGSTEKIIGTGVIYKTNNTCNTHYIFTALHCLYGKRDGAKYLNEGNLKEVAVYWQNENGDYDDYTVKSDKIIPIYEQDLAIMLIEYKSENLRELILGGDINHNGYFNSYGYPKFKQNSPYELKFKRKLSANNLNTFDIECLSSISDEEAKEKIAGYSGAGLFYSNRSVLVGLITQISDSNGFAGAIVVKKINHNLINEKISAFDSSLEYVKHINHTLKIGLKEADGSIINYEKIIINNCELNIWRAIERLKSDLKDDWFQDPINFRFLLSKTFFYRRVEKLINENKLYKPSSLAKHFTVPKSGYSTRPAIETSFIDRIVYQAYVDRLSENLDNVLHPQVYSFRCNSGKSNHKYMFHYSIEQWKKYVYQTKSVLTEGRPFLVVADITNFFENINTTLLSEYLKSLIHDYAENSIKDELSRIVDGIGELIKEWNDKQINSEFGIPQNRDASSFLANIFLNKIDKIMIYSNNHKYYYRYMDDIRIVCESKAEAVKAIYDLSIAMRDLGLNLNSSKTTIFDLKSDEDIIKEFLPESLVEIDQINSLLSAKRKRDVQKAVHMTYKLFVEVVGNTNDEEKFLKKRKLGFCINKLQLFARTKGLQNIIDFSRIIEYVLAELDNQPWLTTSFVKLLMSIDKSYFRQENFNEIKKIIKDNLKNIYESQTYYLWLFLSYMKHSDDDLIQIALSNIKSTNQLNQANTAGSYIYLASIDWRNYKHVMLSSFNKGNLSNNYFLQRNALIALRNVSPNEINTNVILKDLEDLHVKLYDEKKEVFVSDLPKLKISQVINDVPTLISL